MEVNKYQILDLIEEIKKLNEMIALHKEENSSVMQGQYEHKRKELTVSLLEELMNYSTVVPADMNSRIIKLFQLTIENYLNTMEGRRSSNFNNKDLNSIEEALEA